MPVQLQFNDEYVPEVHKLMAAGYTKMKNLISNEAAKFKTDIVKKNQLKAKYVKLKQIPKNFPLDYRGRDNSTRK